MATEEGFKVLSDKIIDRQEDYMQFEMAKDEFVTVLATPDNISIAVPRMASGIRHGHDNLSADILKMMLQFSSRREEKLT